MSREREMKALAPWRTLVTRCLVLIVISHCALPATAQRWELVGPQLESLDALDGAELVATAEGLGTLRSRDAGATWTLVSSLRPSGVVDLDDGSGTQLRWFSETATIERSTDGGLSWAPTGRPAAEYLRGLRVFRGNLYAFGDGIHRSTDGGSSFETVDRLPTESLWTTGRPRTLLRILGPSPQPQSLELSSNDGQGWRPVVDDVISVSQHPSDPDVLVALRTNRAVRRTTDGGRSWVTIASTSRNLSTSADRVSETADGTILWLVASRSAVRRLVPGTSSRWDFLDVVPETTGNGFRVSSSGGVWLATEGGLWRSVDNAASFELVPALGSSAGGVASCEDRDCLVTGAFRRDDLGRWHTVTGWPSGATSPPSRLSPGTHVSFFDRDLLVSGNQGASWTRISTGLIDDLEALPRADEAGVLHSRLTNEVDPANVEAEVHRSDDEGQSWKLIYREEIQTPLEIRLLSAHAIDGDGEEIGAIQLDGVRMNSANPRLPTLEYFWRMLQLDPGSTDYVEIDRTTLSSPLDEPATAIARTSAGDLLVLSEQALLRREGSSWVDVGPIGSALLTHLETDPVSGRVLVANESSIWLSDESASRWEQQIRRAAPPAQPSSKLFFDGLHDRVFDLRSEGLFVADLTSAGESCSVNALCLGDRFEVTARFATTTSAGSAVPRPITADTGAFWFFEPDNLELVVKILDGCSTNDRFWLFAAGLTNVGVTIEVRDTQTGIERTWVHAPGSAFGPLQDVDALAVCD